MKKFIFLIISTSLLINCNTPLTFVEAEIRKFEDKKLNSVYNTEIDFVTAYEHYAIKALRLGASDYLLKPVNIDELEIYLTKRF